MATTTSVRVDYELTTSQTKQLTSVATSLASVVINGSDPSITVPINEPISSSPVDEPSTKLAVVVFALAIAITNASLSRFRAPATSVVPSIEETSSPYSLILTVISSSLAVTITIASLSRFSAPLDSSIASSVVVGAFPEITTFSTVTGTGG